MRRHSRLSGKDQSSNVSGKQFYRAEELEQRRLLSVNGLREYLPLAVAAGAPATPPYIVSINREPPGAISTSSTTVQFLATFSQPVAGVDASDFAIASDPTLKVSGPLVVTQQSSSTYDIGVSGIAGSGSLSVKLIDDHSIVNTSGQHLVSMSPTNVLGSPQPVASQSGTPTVVPDFTGDGKADEISISTDVYAFKGDGTGNFSFVGSFSDGNQFATALCATVGDVNGDHLPDLVAIFNDGKIATFLNTGQGFNPVPKLTSTSLYSGVYSLSLADFNRDGIADLLANGGTNPIFLSNGDGTFSSGYSSNSVNATPVDFNGDGAADLMYSSSASVSVSMNDGTGHFGAPTTVVQTANGFNAAVGDFNGDGKVDIAYLDGRGNVDIMDGNGNGTFTAGLSSYVGVTTGWLTTADFNGDGAPDLLSWNGGSSSPVIALNNGAGGFSSPQTLFTPQFSVNSLQLADVNGDGRPDLVVFGYGTSILFSVTHVAFSSQPYVIAQPAPQIVSLRAMYAPTLNASSIQYTLTFSQPVSGVSSSEFRVTTDGALSYDGAVLVSPVSGSVYTVTVTGLHGQGNVHLTLTDTDQVRNARGQALSQQSITFSQSSYGPASFTPEFLKDINGDGKLDLIGYGSSGLLIAYGDGDGTFQAPSVPTNVPAAFSLLTVGDANGDGTNDLIGTVTSKTLELFPNDGHGNFGVPVVIGNVSPSNESFRWAVTGDFNNDGIIDVVAGEADHTIAFLGIGNDAFRSGMLSPELFSNPVVADLNNDGSLDLVSFDSYDNPMVLLGDGDGSFLELPTTQRNYPLGNVAFADINGDGILDEVDTGDGLGYQPGLGNGTFGTLVSLSNSVGYPQLVATADFNNDGFTDILTESDQYGAAISLGNAAASSLRTIPIGSPFANLSNFLIGDLNGDGRMDWVLPESWNGQWNGYLAEINTANISFAAPAVAITQTYPHIASITRTSDPTPGEIQYAVTFSEPVTGVAASAFTAISTGSVSTGLVTEVPQSASVYLVTIQNVSGNGTIELHFADSGVIRNAVGNPLLPSNTDTGYTISTPNSVGSEGVAATGDFNNDGHADLIGVDWATHIAVGNGDGTFAQPTTYPSGAGYSGLALGDFNNDGKLDYVSLNSQIILSTGNGDGTFTQVNAFDSSLWSAIAVGDVNGDGQTDVVAVSTYNHEIGVYFGMGAGSFLAPVITTLGSASPSSVAVADVNGDGILDALVTYQGVGAYILTGRADGTFVPSTTPLLSDPNVESCAFADLNGDQRPDALVADTTGIHVFLQNATGAFGADQFSTVQGVSGFQFPEIADVNGDGIPDILEPEVAFGGVFLGNGDGTFRSPVVEAPYSESAVVVGDFNGDGRPDMFTMVPGGNGDMELLSNDGSLVSAPSPVGSIDQSGTINTSSTSISLTQDADGQHIDWVAGSQVGQVLINSPSGLVINAAAGVNTNIWPSYVGGDPLPNALHLNGRFTFNGLTGFNPLPHTNLDIGKSTIYLPYTSQHTDPRYAVRNYLKAGYNNGTWTGTPSATAGVITSSGAASNPLNFSVGYADSADAGNPAGLPANTVEIRYTALGDTNLNGTVDINDYNAVIRNFGTGTTWDQGDVTYGVSVSINDYNALIRNFGSVVTSPAVAAAASTLPPMNSQQTAMDVMAATTGHGLSRPKKHHSRGIKGKH